MNPTISVETDDARDQTYRPDKPTAVDRVVDMWTEQARRLQTFWSTWHENVLLGSLERGTRPDRTTSNKRPKGQTAHALIGQYVLVKDENASQFKWKRAQILDLIESTDGVIRTATIHLYPIEVEMELVQTTVTVGNEDPEQPGPSRHAYSKRHASTKPYRGTKPSQTSRLGIKKPNQSRFKRPRRPDRTSQLIQEMIHMYLESTGTSEREQQHRRQQQKRTRRNADE